MTTFFGISTITMIGIRYMRSLCGSRPLLVTISGATRSGKSTMTERLEKRLLKLNHNVKALHLDDFRAYTLGGTRVVDTSGRRNWETPNNINFEVLLQNVNSNVRELSRERTNKRGVLLLEGFCILENKMVRDMSDIIFHLDISKAVCRERRRTSSKYSHPKRDWTFEQYFEEAIWPAHEAYMTQICDKWQLEYPCLKIVPPGTPDEAVKIAMRAISQHLKA